MSLVPNSSWGPPCKGSIKTVVLSNGVKLPVREEMVELIALLSNETMRRGYNLVPGWCWGWSCRKIRKTKIRKTSTWSNHAWGLAVDLNAPKNPRKRPKTTDMPDWMPALWKSYGFRWGGDYTTTPDTMHFEFMGSVSDAAMFTARARSEFSKAPAPAPAPARAPAPAKRPELRFGAKGPDVRYLQIRLEAHRNRARPALRIDSAFGNKTLDELLLFQKAKGLKADGIVGPKTWAALG